MVEAMHLGLFLRIFKISEVRHLVPAWFERRQVLTKRGSAVALMSSSNYFLSTVKQHEQLYCISIPYYITLFLKLQLLF